MSESWFHILPDSPSDMPVIPDCDVVVTVTNDGGTTTDTAKICTVQDIFGNNHLCWIDNVSGAPSGPWHEWKPLEE